MKGKKKTDERAIGYAWMCACGCNEPLSNQDGMLAIFWDRETAAKTRPADDVHIAKVKIEIISRDS